MILEKRKLKYNTARERILDAILAGSLEKDLVLPSEQKLASRLGIGRNTLRTALQELEREGIIIKQNGRPSRVDPDALRRQRVPLRRIAWVDTSPIQHTNPIYFDIFRSVSEGAAVRNVKLDYISLSIEAMAENFFRRQNEYDGLILGEFTPPYQKYLADITHKNTVCVDCPRPGIAHCVKTDSVLGGRLAARTFLEAGCRRLACLCYDTAITEYLPFHERIRGFTDFAARSGCPVSPEHMIMIANAEEDDYFLRFLKRYRDILKETDGIFVVSDKQAADTVQALPEIGFDVPGKISVIGFDGLILSQFLSPPLTTIRQPVEEIGRKALEIVLNPTESASYQETIELPPALQPGGTVRERKGER